MEELIWFSIPGAVIMAAIITVWPSVLGASSSPIVAVILVPVIGFFIHEFYRLIFELTGGFARKSRTVITHILEVLGPREKISLHDREAAFMVWELTIYSENFPAAFLAHDRSAWHYILSFWSISLSAALSALLCFAGYLLVVNNLNVLLLAFGECLVCIVFYWKGFSSYRSLIKQEIAVTYTHESLFVETLKKLKKMK